MPIGNYVNRRAERVDASHFAMSPRSDVPRSAFDFRYWHKTTFDAGLLVPIYVEEVLPADSIRVQMNAFVRLATPITPPMDDLFLESFWFFVPNRLVWSNFERMMGEQATITDTTEFLVPTIPILNTSAVPGTLADWFGIRNTSGVTAKDVNSLPFRAYNLIWNDWFRDQDLQNPITVDLDDGPDTALDYVPRRRGKRPDYFTTARPFTQKPYPASANVFSGFGPVMNPGLTFALPFASGQLGAPVSGIGVLGGTTFSGQTVAEPGVRDITGSFTAASTTIRLEEGPTGYPNVRVLINDIRLANQLQRLMEKNARGGSRYAEIVQQHFGVRSSDARLQRPELLGMGSTPIYIQPVAQTSSNVAGPPVQVLGELAGVGTAFARSHGFSGSFTEHGYILGLLNVRANVSYQQGIHRMWWRRTRYDFYWPSLAHLGEQAILSREIFVDATGTQAAQSGDFSVFGYQERWAEYKTKPNMITSRFRSDAGNTLDIWHFAQDFAARPVLNDAFIQDNPPVDRVLQVGGLLYEQFLCDALFDVRMVRAMPMYSIPGLGDRL